MAVFPPTSNPPFGGHLYFCPFFDSVLIQCNEHDRLLRISLWHTPIRRPVTQYGDYCISSAFDMFQLWPLEWCRAPNFTSWQCSMLFLLTTENVVFSDQYNLHQSMDKDRLWTQKLIMASQLYIGTFGTRSPSLFTLPMSFLCFPGRSRWVCYFLLSHIYFHSVRLKACSLILHYRLHRAGTGAGAVKCVGVGVRGSISGPA
jgi:hypothetical protein